MEKSEAENMRPVTFQSKEKPENRSLKRALRVVLTGGIACGKTVISDDFAALGAPVYDTDLISRKLTAPKSPLLAAMAARFGQDIIAPDGSLRRRALRERVFRDQKALADLNALTHPAIMKELMDEAACCTAPYCILAIPLFFESGRKDVADRVLVADCGEDAQLERLKQRDGVDEAAAKRIIASQTDRATRLAGADDVIRTDTLTLKEIKEAVIKLHKLYLTL